MGCSMGLKIRTLTIKTTSQDGTWSNAAELVRTIAEDDSLAELDIAEVNVEVSDVWKDSSNVHNVHIGSHAEYSNNGATIIYNQTGGEGIA